jgi:hypothetical protein
MAKDKCSSCMYYIYDAEHDEHECHAHPPGIISGSKIPDRRYGFPQVNPDNTCVCVDYVKKS